MRRLFIGPDGIRVGWRLLLFFIFFGVLVTALQQVHRHENAGARVAQ